MSDVDEMTQAHIEQLSEDLAKDAEAARAAHVYDEGYYLAQYKKSTQFINTTDKEFSRKDGSGTFENVFYNVPKWAVVFDLLGFAGRRGDAIVNWDKPKGYSFQICLRKVTQAWPDGTTSTAPESINGGLMQACASNNGFAGKTSDDLLAWYENHMVVIHIGVNKKKSTGEKYNVVRSIKPYNG